MFIYILILNALCGHCLPFKILGIENKNFFYLHFLYKLTDILPWLNLEGMYK